MEYTVQASIYSQVQVRLYGCGSIKSFSVERPLATQWTLVLEMLRSAPLNQIVSVCM